MAGKTTTTGKKTTGTKKPAAKKTEKAASAEKTAVVAEITAKVDEEVIKAAEEAVKRAEEQNSDLKMQNEMLMKQLADIQARLDAASRPQIIQIGQDAAKVQFLWQAEVADDNVVSFGDGGMYGRIVGKTGTFAVPKSDLSRLLDGMNRFFLDKRWLIVLDGLDENEREMMGVNYKEGEILDRQAFAKMVDLGEGILEIYPNLCASHKEMVAKRYNEAYAAGNPHVTRDIVVELNRMSKAAGSAEGDFTAIIEAMNEADAKA